VAPTTVETSFVVAAGVGVWVAAFIADWAAFRLWVPFEAVVAPATVFVFCSLLGAPRHRAPVTALFLAAVLLFELLHRVVRLQGSASWLASDVRRGSGALIKLGAWLSGFAVVFGVVLGPALPGDDSAALLPWREIGDGPSSRITVSPLVDIRGRLVEEGGVEVFTVQSTARAYWRLTALDTFDGQIWSSGGSYAKEDGELPTNTDSSAQEEIVDQTFNVTALAAIWLPAAFEARSIDPGDTSVRWDEDSSTLIVDTELTNSDGVAYTVESDVPHFTADQLDTAPDDAPGSIKDHYLELPSDFSSRAADLAREVTAGASTPYAKALALQQYFRDHFTYSLAVPGGHSESAIEHFLFTTHQGYCEQFAGSYAALARVVGLPSRVAVGFTPGDPDPLQPDLFHVRGEHAHAWPEVYLSGFGWVAFEPTPGRGAPGAQAYTFVPEEQAAAGLPGAATTLVTTPQTVGENPFNDPDITQPPNAGSGDVETVPVAPAGPKGRPAYWLWLVTIAAAVAIVIGATILYVIVVPIAHAIRRAWRRRKAEGAAARVQVAWQESTEAIAVMGVEQRPSETHAEFAGRSARVVEPVLCRELAETAQAAEYSSEGVDDDDADRAAELAEDITADVRRRASREQRARAALDIRPLLPERLRPRKRAKVAAPGEGPALESVP
jgi:transglutaminase-like putative cysteine protease